MFAVASDYIINSRVFATGVGRLREMNAVRMKACRVQTSVRVRYSKRTHIRAYIVLPLCQTAVNGHSLVRSDKLASCCGSARMRTDWMYRKLAAIPLCCIDSRE